MGRKLLTSDSMPLVYQLYQHIKQPCRRWFSLQPLSLASRYQPLIWRGVRFAALSVPLSLLSLAIHAANLTDVNSLISQAVTTHPLVGAARAEEQATAEGITAAKLNLFPMPSITSSYDKDDGMITRAGIRQPLWTGGKLSATVNRAIFDDKAATAYIFEQQNTVAKNTIDIWQSYIYASALQGLYVNNLQQLNEFEAMMKRRVSQGVSARIDLDLVTNRILQDQNAYQGAVQQQRIAEARLSQMIGQPIRASGPQRVPLDQMARYVKAQSTDFEQLAFNSRNILNPSVVKQQYQIEAAKQEVKAQKASQYPAIYAQYEHSYYHKDNDNDGQFSLGLNYDPGAGFSNMALARASEARVQSLEQSQEAARRTVMEDIQTQYQQFVSAKDQETSLIAAVAGSQIVVDSYRRQFIAGRKTWLEVLNAVREKAGYQQQLLQVQSQMLGAFYKLQVDFGRMPWQNFSPMTTPIKEYRPYLEFRDWLKQQPARLDSAVVSFHDAAINGNVGEDSFEKSEDGTILDSDFSNEIQVPVVPAASDDLQLQPAYHELSNTESSNIVSRWLNDDTVIYPTADKLISQTFQAFQNYPDAQVEKVKIQPQDSNLTQATLDIDKAAAAVDHELAASVDTRLKDSRLEDTRLKDTRPESLPTLLSPWVNSDTIVYPNINKVIAKQYDRYQAKTTQVAHDEIRQPLAKTPELFAHDGFSRYPEPSVLAAKLMNSQTLPTVTISETRLYKVNSKGSSNA